jgi:electron transport complex protein RnfE
MLLQAYLPEIYDMLGVYLALIVVNCIILGRAEMFAGKNTVGKSILDGIGMGLGFTIAMLAMATIREVFGAGTFFGIEIPFLSTHTIDILIKAPGGLMVYGLLIAVVNIITKGKAIKKKEFSCAGCPSAGICNGGCATAEKEAE